MISLSFSDVATMCVQHTQQKKNTHCVCVAGEIMPHPLPILDCVNTSLSSEFYHYKPHSLYPIPTSPFNVSPFYSSLPLFHPPSLPFSIASSLTPSLRLSLSSSPILLLCHKVRVSESLFRGLIIRFIPCWRKLPAHTVLCYWIE